MKNRKYDLSVIIPARNEIYLEKTIRNVLENIRGNTEIIAVLDGYIPNPQIVLNDERVLFLHNKEAIGQRQSINMAAKISNSKFIMKLDAHCAVDEGFDVKLMADCEYDWTVIARMYNLDIDTWKPKLHKRTDYMYISSPDSEKPFRAMYYEGKAKDEYQRQPDNDKEIDDIMCCMGPSFFMHRERFWELGGCNEEHGSWGNQGIELSCSAWLSGGSLKVNKKTWFAHWFRGGGGPGFPYPLSGKDVEKARSYSKNLWLNNKWPMQKRPFQFLIDKFNPPGWNKKIVLELGSGKMPKKEGVINVDIRKLPNVDLIADIKKLPYKDGEVDKIMNTDVIEHFGRYELMDLLKEWNRVLKKDGILEVQTVDAGRTMDRWKEMKEKDLLNAILGAQTYEQNFHKMLFTKESLNKYLTLAGFKVDKIKRFSIRRLPRMRAFAKKI